MLIKLNTIENVSRKMANFEKACREADLKITHQRLEIFLELAEASDHPSAEILYEAGMESISF